MAFKVSGESLDSKYLKDSDIFEDYIGNRLWKWGWNLNGQIGDETQGYYTDKKSPVQTISGGTNWKMATSGDSVTAAIKTDGTLWMWGYNNNGQLADNTRTSKSSPIQTIAGGTNWKQVSAGGHVAAIKTDGTLWLWGYNLYGQLGDNTSTNQSSPVQTISGGTNWKSITSGVYTTVAIKTDGTLWTWGQNYYGQLGDNSSGTNRSSPIQTISGGTNWKTVCVGNGSVAAIKTDGTLWMWGDNSNGLLGDNTMVLRSSPVQTVAGGTNWKQAVTLNHTAAIKTDGTLWVWGLNVYGQLGNNNVIKYSSPVQTIAGGTNWKQVDVGAFETAAIKTDGTLWLWGNNYYLQLASGTGGWTTASPYGSQSSPVQTIAGGNNWKSVSMKRTTLTALTFSDQQ
jgi:alpha-tubulin suppressor-like RCC1 family protein